MDKEESSSQHDPLRTVVNPAEVAKLITDKGAKSAGSHPPQTPLAKSSSSPPLLPSSSSTAFVLGLTLLILLAAVFGGWVLPRLKIETDLLALLPAIEEDAGADAAVDSFSQALARNVVFLVGAPQVEDAREAGKNFAAQLRDSGAFDSVQGEVGTVFEDMAQLYARHRAFLLSTHDQTQLASGHGVRVYDDALRAAYTPAGMFRPLPFAQDPLGLGAHYFLEQVPNTGSAQVEEGWLTVRPPEPGSPAGQYPHSSPIFVIVTAQAAGSPFSADVQDKARAAIEHAREAAARVVQTNGSTLSFVSSGVLQHATAATHAARAEISTFGTLDTLCVLSLMLALFRTWRAPALGALALAGGGAAGLMAAHFIFGPVHLIALVFGTSLIGVAIDYAMHFFSDQFRAPREWTPSQALGHVGRPIVLGLCVALLGYFGLLLLPFPGLKQMAVISIAGLIVACVCVFTLFPRWARGSGRELPAWCESLLTKIDANAGRLRRRPVKLIAGFLMLIVIVGGLAQLRTQDDVRALQASDSQALQNEKKMRALLGLRAESRFFLALGNDTQAALQTEEKLTAALDTLVSDGKLDGYSAITRALPSRQRQEQTKALLEREVYAPQGVLPRLLRELGFDEKAIARELQAFQASIPLDVQQWLVSPAAQTYRHLWLGAVADRHATAILLQGVHDPEALQVIAGQIPDVRFIDRVGEISTVLAKYRRAVLALLAGIYLVVCLALSVRYGLRGAVALVFAPAGATALTLAFAGWIGLPLTLFVALALLLLLGLGVDYAIFLREAQAEHRTALLAVTLSALTTMISFGLLSFSSTPLIHAIGMTLGVGIASCWLLAVVGFITNKRP